ncbi:MAG: FAD:protein FMN transferase [Acidimicrobiales bacterium]
MTTATLDICDELAVASAPALASNARVIVRTSRADPGPGCDPALAVFRDVNLACSRFDPESELRRVNAHPDTWHVVGKTCSTALREAWWAYRRTSSEFDPRLHVGSTAGATPPPWRPRFADAARRVHLGGLPVDLDGIARGLALRWARRALRGSQHFVSLGDAWTCSGRGLDGGPWRIGLQDPAGDPSPLAVVGLTDTACVTSTVARASIAGQPVPSDLLAVTIVNPDAVAAAVWSMVLLTAREPHIAEVSARLRLPAAWVTDDGTLHTSPALEPKILWRC